MNFNSDKNPFFQGPPTGNLVGPQNLQGLKFIVPPPPSFSNQNFFQSPLQTRLLLGQGAPSLPKVRFDPFVPGPNKD